MSDSAAAAAPESAAAPATTSTTATTNDDSSWRLPGQSYRSSLLAEDEITGGSSFVLNPTVPITKYYQVSRRAYHQFRDSCGYLNEHNGELTTCRSAVSNLVEWECKPGSAGVHLLWLAMT